MKKPKRRWVRTTDSNHGHRVYPNLLQNLAVTGPNQAWAADITYIGIRSGFVYLVTAIGDSTLADAILDRLVHNAHKLNLKGGSMRKKQAKLT